MYQKCIHSFCVIPISFTCSNFLKFKPFQTTFAYYEETIPLLQVQCYGDRPIPPSFSINLSKIDMLTSSNTADVDDFVADADRGVAPF